MELSIAIAFRVRQKRADTVLRRCGPMLTTAVTSCNLMPVGSTTNCRSRPIDWTSGGSVSLTGDRGERLRLAKFMDNSSAFFEPKTIALSGRCLIKTGLHKVQLFSTRMSRRDQFQLFISQRRLTILIQASAVKKSEVPANETIKKWKIH